LGPDAARSPARPTTDLSLDPATQNGLIGAILGLSTALLWLLVARSLLERITRATSTTLDDELLEVIRRPIGIGLALAGVGYALALQPLATETWFVLRGLLESLAIALFARVMLRSSTIVLDHLARRGDTGLVQPATLPLLQIGATVACWAGAIYFVMLAWKVDIRGWLASAGVVGIAVGFAAQDTLANLFAGFFILMDRPYKLGDYLVLESGERGRVTVIGIRTTRLQTRDDEQVIIPNSVMADARILNESGGPQIDCRIKLVVDVAYGSDLDRAAEVMVRVARETEGVLDNERQPPHVRYASFEDSGIRAKLLCWVPQPKMRDAVVDRLVRGVHKAFVDEGIEIPFPQRVVHAAPGTFNGTDSGA
jgi:MscS family membrane protein